jgi:hypothetical protein
MIKRLLNWFISPSEKPILCDDYNVYDKLLELEEKYENLLCDFVRLEEENIETTNTLYELMNSIDAVDARIDILTLEKWKDKDV